MAVAIDWIHNQIDSVEPAASVRAHAECTADMIIWPDAWRGTRRYWSAPVAAYRLTALIAANDVDGVDRMWTALDLIEQVNIIAALSRQARYSVHEAERWQTEPVMDLGALCGEVNSKTLAAATAILTKPYAWQIPTCPECLWKIATALAGLIVVNWQAILRLSRPLIAHTFAHTYGRIAAQR